MTSTYPITGFSRGFADNYMSGRGAQRMDNFVLDDAGNPVQRSGQVVWGPAGRIPANQKISDLYYVVHDGNGQVYAHTAGNIYGSTLSVTEQGGPFAWDTFIGPNSAKPGRNAEASTRMLLQSVGPFNYVSFWGTATTTYLTHPKVKRLSPQTFPGVGGSVNMGLPVPASGSVAQSAGVPGAFSYVYYFVFVYTYTYNSVSYTERSAPYQPPTSPITLDAAIGTNTADGHGVHAMTVVCPTLAAATIYTAADQNYPVTEVEVYRTKANESIPYLVGSAHADGATFTDNVVDGSLGIPLYTSDGTAPYDEPPPCQFFHVVGDIGIYAGFFYGSGYDQSVSSIQSVPGVLYSAPSDFEIRAPDSITGGITSNDIYFIYLCQNSLWRLEGSIDSFGNGAPVFRLISDKVGCVLPSTVKKFGRVVRFMGSDGGFYETDGFNIRRLSDHITRYLASVPYAGNFFVAQDYTHAGQMGCAIDPRTGRTFWSMSTVDGLTAPASVNNLVLAADPRFPIDDKGNVAFTTFSGRSHETLGDVFRPHGMDFVGSSLVFGDSWGYVFRLQPEPAVYAGTLGSVPDDVVPNTAVAIASWQKTAVVPDWVSQALDYGYGQLTKITTSISILFNLLFAQTVLAVDIFSYREGKYRSDALVSEEMKLAAVRETALDSNAQSFSAWRRLRRQGLRATLRQFRVKKGYVTQYASDPNGVNTYPTAAIDHAGKTAQLGSTTSWPTDIIYSYLYLEADYDRGFLITAVSGDTVTVYDPSGLLPTDGGPFKWEIKTYPKNQWLSFLSVDASFFVLGTPDNAATAAKAALNTRAPT